MLVEVLYKNLDKATPYSGKRILSFHLVGTETVVRKRKHFEQFLKTFF